MEIDRVILDSTARLKRDPATNHVSYRQTLDSMAAELNMLRQCEHDNESLRAENAGLKEAIATYRSTIAALEPILRAIRPAAASAQLQLEEKAS